MQGHGRALGRAWTLIELQQWILRAWWGRTYLFSSWWVNLGEAGNDARTSTIRRSRLLLLRPSVNNLLSSPVNTRTRCHTGVQL